MAEKSKSDCDCMNQWEYLEIAQAKGPNGSILEQSIREKKSHEFVANQVRFCEDSKWKKTCKI